MKKGLLTITALALACASSFGQSRVVLYEEFTGENCAPCAATNPKLDSLMAGQSPYQATNANKVLMIKYMSPIPSAGQFYYQNQAQSDARISYYSVPFAPYARMDGAVPDPTAANPGHPGYLTQADIDAATAVPSSFTITFTQPTWNATFDSFTVDIMLTAGAAGYTGGTVKLRTALVENVDWATPPGNNGEKDFPNVVRSMYPDANGQAIANTWAANQTQTITVKGYVPDYVDKAGAPFIAAWIQDDANKAVAQAGKSAPLSSLTKDVSSTGVTLPTSVLCTAATATSVPTVTLKNTGTTALTSAAIYTKIDAGAWTLSQTWTGSLAPNATTTVALTALSLTTGQHTIYDSVGQPNTTIDYNPANNVTSKTIAVISTAGHATPITTGFENAGAVPTDWTLYDPNGNSENWVVAHSGTATQIGHGSTEWFLWHCNYQYAVGETNYAIVPTPTISGATAIDFWTAHAQFTGYTDKLEVVYSTNCGSSWTSLWTKSDPQLAYGLNSSDPNNWWLPSGDADWHLQSVDLSTVPAGAIVALKATSGFGNNLFVDDVNIRAGAPTGVNTLAAATTGEISIFPNPAKDMATLQFMLSNNSNVQVVILDAMGRVVSNVTNEDLLAGTRQVQIPTANLAAGIYNVRIQTEGGVSTQRLTVAK